MTKSSNRSRDCDSNSLDYTLLDVALFDVDHTLSKVNISIEFGRFLYKQGFFSTFQTLSFILLYSLHLIHLLPLKALHIACFYCLFYRKKKEDVERLVEQFFEEQGFSFFNKKVLEELRYLQAHNVPIVIASSSPSFLIEKIAHFLGVKKVLATSYEIDMRGRYSSISCLVDGRKKTTALSEFSLDRALAYSDSELDMPLFDAVGYQVAVSPTRKLRCEAEKKGWRIIE